jgi:hypothetical protein
MFVANSSRIFSLHLKCCNVIKYKNTYCKANILNVPHILCTIMYDELTYLNKYIGLSTAEQISDINKL